MLACIRVHGRSTLKRIAKCTLLHSCKCVGASGWVSTLEPTGVSSSVGSCLGSSALYVRSTQVASD